MNLTKLLSILVLLLVSNAAFAELRDVGFRVNGTRIDDPDFYSASTKTGAAIQELTKKHADILSKPLDELPADFDPYITAIYNHIQTTTIQTSYRNKFYVGVNGELNGPEFDFHIENLPTKITKLSFCFGFDPLMFAGLISQESHFKRDATSPTGAFGFTQLTSTAVAEVSEQLGILGEGHHGKDAPEVFNQYISCYLGSDKVWTNIWEDERIPLGKEAYVGNKVKSGRVWKYQADTKKWFDEDPDRNLIYGAILFKLYLGHFGNYDRAASQYNISHPKTYLSRLIRNYRKMENLVVASNYKPVNYSGVQLKMNNSNCFLQEDEWVRSEEMIQLMGALYPDDELEQMLETVWTKKGFCKPIQIKL